MTDHVSLGLLTRKDRERVLTFVQRLLSSSTYTIKKRCRSCGRVFFTPKRKQGPPRLYCNGTCKVRAWRNT